MAKQIGPVKIIGTIDDMVFYQQDEEYYVRYNGTVSRYRILKSAAYDLFRRHSREFIGCQKIYSRLKRAFRHMLSLEYRFSYLRFVQLMLDVRKLDLNSAFGERNIGKALQNKEAIRRILGFDFNVDSPLSQKLRKPIQINETKGIGIADILPAQDIDFPNTASLANIRAARLHTDFLNDQETVVPYSEVWLRKDGPKNDILLQPLSDTMAHGTVFYFLQIHFYRLKKDGKKKRVGEGRHDAMCIIAINPQPGIQLFTQPPSGPPSQKLWQRRQRSTSQKLIDHVTGKVYKEGDF